MVSVWSLPLKDVVGGLYKEDQMIILIYQNSAPKTHERRGKGTEWKIEKGGRKKKAHA